MYKFLSINGGGDASQSRGAGITFYGNEVGSNEGRLWIGAGNSGSANGFINFNTAGLERVRIDSSGSLLLGTTSSKDVGFTHKLQLEGTSTAPHSFSIIANRADAHAAHIDIAKSRGASVGSNTVVQDDDYLGHIVFRGADGTDLASSGAQISAAVDGTPGSNNMPGRLEFKTTADGAASPTERMRIDSSGNVGIGCSPANVLHSVGTTRINQSSTLGHTTNAGTMLEVRGNAIGDGVVDFDYFKGFKIALNDQTEWGGQAQFAVGRWEDSGNSARSSLMISLGHGQSSSATDADTDVLLLKSNGSVTISDGDLVIGTAGHGIDFSAQTASSATGATTGSEVLAHYEEGSWTPVFYTYNGSAWVTGSFTTNPTIDARYTRIGRYVLVTVRATSFQTNNSGVAYAMFAGLPFTAVNYQGSGSLSYTNAAFTSEPTAIQISGTQVEFYVGPNWAAWSNGSSGHIGLSASYMI